MKERYHTLMLEFVEKHFQVATIEQQIDLLAALIEPAVIEDSRDSAAAVQAQPGWQGPWPGWQWAAGGCWAEGVRWGRVESVNEQLVGKSKGERPQFGAH
jgi:hypothetical protein